MTGLECMTYIIADCSLYCLIKVLVSFGVGPPVCRWKHQSFTELAISQ